MDSKITLGNRLHTYRKLAGLTLKEVAYFNNMSLSFLSDIEHGRTNPSINTLKRLAGFYKVSVDTLLADVRLDPPAQPPALNAANVSAFEVICTDYECTKEYGDYGGREG